MGVPGLWDLLRPAAARTSLSTLAREAFYTNRNGLRALTIGIDASIWIFHAQIPQYGENPFLRTIFFKVTSLMQHPVLPVFVFDGPNKPSHKRNQSVAGKFGTSDARSKQFKALLDACGLEWWNAPGEAEAELAIMNRQGKIDAILSDDVDALLFGATCLLRNNSPTLSGAQASSTQPNSSKADQRHYEVYRSSAIQDILSAKNGSALTTEEDCRMAMVLIALLGGGDYAPEGLAGFGATISHALASAGCSEYLKLYLTDPEAFATQLPDLHARMISELRTNSTKQIGRKYPDRAAKLASRDPASLFPAFALDAYLRPATSPANDPLQGWPGFGRGENAFQKRGRARNEGRGDLEGFAKACETFFEWGTREIVVKKFASESVGLFGAEVMSSARARVREASGGRRGEQRDKQGMAEGVGSRITSFFQATAGLSSSSNSASAKPSNTGIPPNVLKIVSTRADPTNSELLEYRLTYDTATYVNRCHSAMDGSRLDPKDLDPADRAALGLVDKAGDDDPSPSGTQVGPSVAGAKSEIRMWIADYLVREAWPELIEAYEEEQRAKLDAKAKKTRTPRKGIRVKARPAVNGEDPQRFFNFFTHRARTSTPDEVEEELEELQERSVSRVSTAASGSLSSVSPDRLSHRPSSGKGKKNARPLLTSSVSSRSSPNSFARRSDSLVPPPSRTGSVPQERPQSSSPPTAKARPTRHRNKVSRIVPSSPTTPQPSKTRTVRSTQVRTRGVAVPIAVVDLCSSGDEATPKQRGGDGRSTSGTPSVAASSKGILTNSIVENAPSTALPAGIAGRGRRGSRGSGHTPDRNQDAFQVPNVVQEVSKQKTVTSTSKRKPKTVGSSAAQTRLNTPIVAKTPGSEVPLSDKAKAKSTQGSSEAQLSGSVPLSPAFLSALKPRKGRPSAESEADPEAGMKDSGAGNGGAIGKQKEKENGKEREREPLYIVTYEDDSVVMMDVRPRWRKGERMDAA